MSFNLDDPLADILSDDSNDSFFNDDNILGKKKSNKKNSTADKKKKLFNLNDPETVKKEEKLDVVSKVKEEDIIKPSSKTNTSKVAVSPILKHSFSKESVKIQGLDSKSNIDTFDSITKSPLKAKSAKSIEKLDILDELLEEKKTSGKQLEKGKSSQSLLDDILGGTSKQANQHRPTTTGKSQDLSFDKAVAKSESKQTYSNTTTRILSNPIGKPEQTTVKKPADDWLGIFQNNNDDVDDEDDMPSWLTGGTKKKKAVKEIKSNKDENNETKEDVIEKENIRTEIPEKEIGRTMEELMKPISVGNVDMNNDDVTMEGAAMCLQQQEAQLMVALQLKAQDEKLAAMQIRQKESQRVQREAVTAHHEQVDSMLRRQAEHRRQMQAIIATHQDRITQRIKALLDNNDANEPAEEDILKTEGGYESPFAKEKKQLLQLVQSLQENHDKEIDLMETSYRRQLEIIEISYNQSEARLKEDSEKAAKYYAEKIGWLEEHHQLYKRMAEENLNSLSERHKSENDMLRSQHLDNIRILQEHHGALVENIKNAVKQEQVLLKDSAGFSNDLQQMILDVKENNSKCEQLCTKVDMLREQSHRDVERQLETREKQINDMIEQLKKDRDDFEKDKSDSKETVKILENRLRQMTTMIEEETASLKQKKMEFEFEKATFSKQTEFAKTVLKKQDEELKMLKDDIEKEHKIKMDKLEEERSKLLKDSALVAKEKASAHSLKMELEKTKAELDAQLEEAAEARSRLNAERQELHIEEQRIVAKGRDLDMLAKTSIERQAQAEKKLSEAEFIQHKYEDRIRRIQEHVVSLNNREKQIAKEKVALSRERLSLHNEKKEMENRQCSLCRSAYYPVQPYPENVGVQRDYDNLNCNVNNLDMEMSMMRPFASSFVGRDTQGGGGSNAMVSEPGSFKDYTDPKFTMLRLDVQKVISNMEHTRRDDDEQ
ncbi:interaptin [Leptidea sinapis]|uniref:interaptin n=1 Tax=Leptidea sinapis TaxID=189913 RepID=UPI0021381035|nr:interaptin [Leptidea sinapis]